MKHKANQIGLYIDTSNPQYWAKLEVLMKNKADLGQCLVFWECEYPQSNPPPLQGMVVIDKSHLAIPFIRDDILTKWGNQANFLENGFGVILGDKFGEWQGYCYAGAVAANHAELSIKVQTKFRQKGIGSLLGHGLLSMIRERGLSPVWTCMADNIPSVRLAKKLGFCKMVRYPFFYWTTGIQETVT